MKPRRHHSVRRLLALSGVLGALILAASLASLAALDWERTHRAHEYQVAQGHQLARAMIQERLLDARLLAQQAASEGPAASPTLQATLLTIAPDGTLLRSSSGRSLPRLASLAPALLHQPASGIELDDQGALMAVGTYPGPDGLAVAAIPFTAADVQAIKSLTGLDASFVAGGLRLLTTLQDAQGQPLEGQPLAQRSWEALTAEPEHLHLTADPSLPSPYYEEMALLLHGLEGTPVAVFVAGRPSPGFWASLWQWGWPWAAALVANLAATLALVGWLQRRLGDALSEARRAILKLANRRDAESLRGGSGLAELDDMIRAVNQLGMDRAALVMENSQLNERLVQTQTLTALGQVAVGVAHDLNNPLATIIGLADIIQNADMDPDTQRDLAVMRRQAERSSRLVRSLLSFARQRAELQWVSVNDLIAQTLDLLAYQARVANIRCELDLNQDLPLTWADPSPLLQVLFNLINNAIQAMAAAHGRGTLRVQSSWSPPDPGAPYGRIAIRVEDDGPGIPDKVWPHLFKPFFTTKGPAGGTGLGLATSADIVQRHGGRLWADNNPDGGASFFVELPVVTEALGEGDDKAEGRRRILLADSNPQRINALAQALRRRGYCLRSAGDGLSARHKIELEAFDLVLCAFELARLDGRELYAWTRTRHPTLARRFLFIAPASNNGEVEAFLQATRLPALRAPWSEDALEALLNQSSLI